MLRCSVFVLFVISSLSVLSCATDSVVQTGQIIVQFDHTVDFTQFETFSVVTADIVDPPDLDEDQQAFNDMVNELIKEAMQAEPVCLTLIEPEDVTDENQPDLVGCQRSRPDDRTKVTTTSASVAGGGATGAGTGIPASGGCRDTSNTMSAICSFPSVLPLRQARKQSRSSAA